MTVEKKLNNLIGMIKAWIEKEEAGGCEGCHFIDRDEWELPCRQCKRNCKDYWRRQNDD